MPDRSTPSRRAETLEVLRRKAGSEPVHLLVDSTGLKLCGAGEWLTEKHGTKRRRSWRKLHLATDADTGRIVASELTDKDTDDGSQVGPLLDQVDGPVGSLTADGAFDRDDVYAEVVTRHPDAAVVVPPRSSGAPGDTAETAPTRRDAHLRCIAERGRIGWQRASGSGVLWWRPISRDGNASSATSCARRRVGGSDRGGHRRRGAEPYAGAWTPGVCPHYISRNMDRAQCRPHHDPSNTAVSRAFQGNKPRPKMASVIEKISVP